MIVFKEEGDLRRTTEYLRNVRKINYEHILQKYGEMGVQALSSATPVRTGLTAESWSYEIKKSSGKFTIYWKNSNIENGIPVAVLIQYGHATKSGGFVEGIDYINPALKSVFENIASEAWREVTRA